MSVLNEAFEEISGRIQDITTRVKRKVFGVNNERLDFMMDSFYKLNPGQRNAVLAGIIGSIGFFVLGALALYSYQVNSLKKDLNESFAAIHELESLKSDYASANSQFEQLVKLLEKKTKSLKMKPFFEKLSKQHQVSIEGLNEQQVELPADNPLSEEIKEVVSEMRLPKISIPRLLNFLVEIEKSNNFLRVQDLAIRGRFGTKLYFDAEIKVRGYLKK